MNITKHLITHIVLSVGKIRKLFYSPPTSGFSPPGTLNAFTSYNIELNYGSSTWIGTASLHNFTVTPSANNTVLIDSTTSIYSAFRIGDEGDNKIRDYPCNIDTALLIDFDLSQTAIRDNVAAGGGASSITLDASASPVDDFYNTNRIVINAGTGVGQSRAITDYDGTTKVATVDAAWTTQPDATSNYVIVVDNTPTTFTSIKAQIPNYAAALGVVGFDFSNVSGRNEFTQVMRIRNPPTDVAELPGTYICWGGQHAPERPRIGAYDSPTGGGQSLVIGGNEAYEANGSGSGSIGSTVPTGYSTTPSRWLRLYDDSGVEYLVPAFNKT